MIATERRDRPWVALAAVASFLLRLRFLATPLGVDEAGALVAARSWAHGRHLYRDVFIDRPQGVVVLFQRWDALSPFGPSSIRLVAALAGFAAVWGAATVARSISGTWQAGAAAAWVVAVLSSSAAFEGYAANGELLAGGLTVPAMAIGALVITRRLPSWAMAGAGVLAAAGMTMKQSGFDVGGALGLWLILAFAFRWRRRPEAAAQLAWLAVGAAVVLGAVAVQGTTFGWEAYSYALYGFRAHARSAMAGPQLWRMALTIALAVPLLLPVTVVSVQRLRATGAPVRPRVRPEHALALVWLGLAVLAFAVGGNFHRHYWIELTFPIAVLAGLCLAVPTRTGTVRQPPDATSLRRLLTWSLALPLVLSLLVIAVPGIERDHRVDADIALARWYDQHRTPTSTGLMPLCASVTYYADAGSLPRTRYLWVDHVRFGRGSTTELVRLLDAPDRPSYLALVQPLAKCDPTGRVRAAVARHYIRATTIEGVPVLRSTN